MIYLDIDECLSSPCGLNTTCNNFPGFYNCTCGDGYIWYKNEKKCNISGMYTQLSTYNTDTEMNTKVPNALTVKTDL